MMSNSHLHGRSDDSGLINLMEAATALTQLVGSPVQAISSRSAPSMSPVTYTDGRAFPNSISDDDGTASSRSNIHILRENHLQALRAASLAAIATQPAAEDLSVNTSETSTKPNSPAPVANSVVPIASKDKEIFPMRLHALLSDASVRDVISWLPHGKSFVILRPDEFATRVLPRYFAPEGSSKGGNVHKYPSFTRKLNRWGFRQISRGADAGAFCHELFCRDQPEACRDMVCQKSRKTVKEDCKSVSSASTMSILSGEKRAASAAVTVSTSGGSGRSLPLKKRRGFAPPSNHVSGIPENVEMKPNNTSLITKKVAVNSDAETVSNLSLDGSVSPPNPPNKNKTSGAPSSVQLSAEAAAKDALARHFYEQHRAFALASLMENSRLAMLARGMDVQSADKARAASSVASMDRSRESLCATTNPQVFAPTVAVAANNATKPQISAAAEAAKNALFEAYKRALASSP